MLALRASTAAHVRPGQQSGSSVRRQAVLVRGGAVAPTTAAWVQQQQRRRQQRDHAAVVNAIAAAATAASPSAPSPVKRFVAAFAASVMLLHAAGPAGAAEALAPEAAAAATGPQTEAVAACSPAVGDLGGLFGGSDEGAPEPFTLYGSNFKLFSIEEVRELDGLIERRAAAHPIASSTRPAPAPPSTFPPQHPPPPPPQLDGNKVVSRSRGFTVDTCVSAVDESVESPEFQGLSSGDKVNILIRGERRQASSSFPLALSCVGGTRAHCNPLTSPSHSPISRPPPPRLTRPAAVRRQPPVQAVDRPRPEAGVRLVVPGGLHRRAGRRGRQAADRVRAADLAV
jgi:hypothetical protein